MRKYLSVYKILFRTQLVWRFDVIMSALFSFFQVLLAYILWGAIFNGKELVAGFTFAQMLTYYIVSAFIRQLDLSPSMASEVGDRIKNGTFSGRMVIPVNIKGYFYASSLGASAFYALFNILATTAWILVYGNHIAFTPIVINYIMAALLVVMGLVFMHQFHFALGMLAFKYTEVWVFLMIKNNILAVISGAIIPLSLMPAFLVNALKFLPFYYVSYLPGMLAIGKGAGEAWMGVGVLIFWNLVIYLVNRLGYERLRVKYEGVGI